MPISIDSITFADEFNTGTTTSLNANVSDEITATINITFQSLIDADSSSSRQIKGESYSIFPYSSNQSFLLENYSLGTLQNSNIEFLTNGIEIETDVGAGGTFTIAEVIAEGLNTRIICNESTSITSTAPKGKIWISEAITDCNLDYRVSGTSNNNDYEPTIEISGNTPANFSTTTSPLLASDTVTINTIPFKYNGAYQTGGLTIRGTGTTTYSQSFELIHTFIPTPISIYNEGTGDRQPDNYTPAQTSSYQNLFNSGLGNARYSFLGSFSNAVSNGVQIPFNFEPFEFGNVFAFNKSNTGADTNYSYSNFSIIRTSDSLATAYPLIQTKFTVSFDIENTEDSPFVTAQTKVKVGIENLPQIIGNTEDYKQTFLYDNAINTVDAGASAGSATGDAASITNYTCTLNSATSVTCSFDVEFTANAITQIGESDTPYFSIFTETQDHTLNYSNNDRVVLQVYKGIGIPNIYEDPINVVQNTFVTAPFSDIGNGVDATEISGFPVQLLVGATRFYADWTDRNNLRINTINQSLVLKNSITLEEIELEKEVINVNGLGLIDSTYPNANYSKVKGYKIPSDEIRNLVRLYNDGDATNVHYFQALFPFFIRWEYYKQLTLTDVPSSILDNTQDFDGVNYFLDRIANLTNWSLNYRVNFECSEDGVLFNQDFDYTLPTTNYNAHDDVTSRSIVSKKTDGTSLNISGTKYIESTEDTEITYTCTLGTAPSSINDFEMELYIEVYENGSPKTIQRISSINGLLSGSWFEDTGALDGFISKSIDGNDAIGKAYINVETLAKYPNYRIYGQIYTPPRPTDNFVAENGDNLITEDSNNLTRE